MSGGKAALLVVPGAGAVLESTVQLSDRDDDELMLLVGGSHRAAFDELVRRHRRRLLGVATRYVKSANLAHDVTQNTFLEVFRAAPRYQPRGAFTSFLYRVLLNQCRMVHRAALSEDRFLTTAATELGGQVGPTTEERILARERERRVQRAIDRLSEKLRVVVVLRYTGGLSYQEIAEVVDIPLGTAKRRLFDALEKLRTILQEDS